MFVFKKLFVFILIILISSCALNNFKYDQNINNYSIIIETPIDKYNLYFKENLKRYYQASNTEKIYKLKTRITFETTKTLSVGGKNVLKSTKAIINYQLTDNNTNIIKSGSIKTFPALSSSSDSLYSQEKSIEHIKDRLTRSSAKSLYTHINIILRRLS